jgi:hypothetical protein
LSEENERLSRSIERHKREEEDLNARYSRLNWCLEEDYKLKKKRLEEEYLKFKQELQAAMKKLQDDCNALKTKRDKLKTECHLIEKQRANTVNEAEESLDKIKAETEEAVKERNVARDELMQLRASVGPRGTVTDLLKQKKDLKAALREKDQQLAEKALWLSRDFNARMEAERIVTEERTLMEHLIEKAGALPNLFLFLSNPQHFPKEHFKELNSLLDELEVWRGYENPPSLYKNVLSKSKDSLKQIKADIEKCLEGA